MHILECRGLPAEARYFSKAYCVQGAKKIDEYIVQDVCSKPISNDGLVVIQMYRKYILLQIENCEVIWLMNSMAYLIGTFCKLRTGTGDIEPSCPRFCYCGMNPKLKPMIVRWKTKLLVKFRMKIV